MERINRDILIPYMSAYKTYLKAQVHGENARPLSNEQEEYKRRIAVKAAETLNQESWNESEIGTGAIGNRVIKAVHRNSNLIGRFQVSAFADKIKKDPGAAERVLFDLYHDRKDQECFDQLCGLLGRKYDLMAYLFFILDPGTYLPLRSSIFDGIFKKLQINLQTEGRCSWGNYQEFLSTITSVRDVMREYFQTADVDLLDAHSFLWTLNLDVLNLEKEESEKEEIREKTIEKGTEVLHKSYGKGNISKITEDRIYIQFDCGLRIFPFTDAFEKGYLMLI